MTDIIFLGVVNATPNSFSDAHKNLKKDFQTAQLDKFYKANYSLDIGAESTAPFNDAIDAQTEWGRLNLYIDTHLARLRSFQTISIDTYKLETMTQFMESYGHHFKHIIWNDVSGVICDKAIELLKKYPKLEYIFCHNLAGRRDLSNSHMDYLRDELSLNELKDFFINGIRQFEAAEVSLDRLILDPCFGFSKTLEQNLSLLDEIHEIKDIHPHWLIGISKKSFLRHLVSANTSLTDQVDIHMESETYHWDYLKRFKRDFEGVKTLYFRVHEAGNITD